MSRIRNPRELLSRVFTARTTGGAVVAAQFLPPDGRLRLFADQAPSQSQSFLLSQVRFLAPPEVLETWENVVVTVRIGARDCFSSQLWAWGNAHISPLPPFAGVVRVFPKGLFVAPNQTWEVDLFCDGKGVVPDGEAEVRVVAEGILTRDID